MSPPPGNDANSTVTNTSRNRLGASSAPIARNAGVTPPSPRPQHGEREHIFFVVLVVTVAPIDFEAARRRGSQKHVGAAGHGERYVDFFLKLALADISDRRGTGLDRAPLGDLRARRIEQRAALGCVFVEVGEFLAVLAAFDQRLLVVRRDVREAAEPVLHIAQPVAAFGIFALVDDIDADVALAGDDRRHVFVKVRLVAGRYAAVKRPEWQAADMGCQDPGNASLHCARVYSAASTALSCPARTSRPGMAPVCSPRSKIGVPATSVAS